MIVTGIMFAVFISPAGFMPDLSWSNCRASDCLNRDCLLNNVLLIRHTGHFDNVSQTLAA